MYTRPYLEKPINSNTEELFEQRFAESPRDYYTRDPNIVWELGYKYSVVNLYHFMRRMGQCTMSLPKIAQKLDMDIKTVRSAKKKLTEPHAMLGGKSLIKVVPRVTDLGDPTTDLVIIEDIWVENHMYFKSKLGVIPKTEPGWGGGGTENGTRVVPKTTYKEDSPKEPVVVVTREAEKDQKLSEQPPPAEVKSEPPNSITIRDHKGKESTLTRDDLYRLGVVKEWTPSEIQSVWEAISSYQGRIRDWAKYAEGIVASLRINDDAAHGGKKSRIKIPHPKPKQDTKPKKKFDPSTWI